MPRLRANQSVASPSTVSKKRAAPETVSTPLRQSKRARNSSNPSGTPLATPKKSEYFEPSETEAESEIENEKSGYEDEDQSASVLSSLADTDAEEDASEDDRPRKRNVDKKMTSNKAKKATNGNTVQGQELWRPGVKADVEPGVQVFIKLPKARQPGKNPYKDGTIHPNTMLFLGDLKANNDREWLKVHDADYRQAKKDFESFVECLTEKVIEKDETIPELPPKDLVFRIYRDVRFSSDPTPYKTHFSAAWSRTGRKGPYAHYYMQIAPDDTFIGGGIWMPEAQPLALLRNDVDHRSRKIKKVLMDAGIRKEFLDGARGNEQECITAFIGRNKENMLKTKPKVNLKRPELGPPFAPCSFLAYRVILQTILILNSFAYGITPLVKSSRMTKLSVLTVLRELASCSEPWLLG